MPNALVNVNVAQIADRTMDHLGLSMFPVTAMGTDFSDEIKNEGESVKTRLPGSVTVSNLANGYTPSDVSNTGVTVTLDQFWGPVFAFTDLEASKAGNVMWLRDNFIEPAVEALLDKIMQTFFELVVSANYSNSKVITDANFDSDELATLGGDMTTLKVPKSNRALIVPPSYYTGLVKDSVIEDMSAFGDNEAIKNGEVRKARGFRIYEYGSIPNNGQNLAGFVCHRSAMAFAARAVVDPTKIDGNAPIGVENRVDPVTGLPIQFRVWYDGNAGKFKFSMGTLWGVAKGQGNGLKRILSA